MKIIFAPLCALAALLLLSSCESFQAFMKADPAPTTSFLSDASLLKEQKATFPFDRMWHDQNLDWDRIEKLKFDAVDTSHMLADSWWQSINEADAQKMRKDVPELAAYMRNAFIQKLKLATKSGQSVTSSVDEHTAIVQLALVQVVPTKAFFNAAGTVAGFFIPGASLLNMGNAGCVAMECRIIDGKTGKVVMMLTDRTKDGAAIIDVNALTWYGHAKETMDSWAEKFATLAVTKDTRAVKRDFPISLISI